MKRIQKFCWEEYEDKIRYLIYSKAKNNTHNEAIFSVTEIVLNSKIDSDDIDKFEKWLYDKKIVKSVQLIGHNLFTCVATDSLLKDETSKELFGK